MKEKNTISIEDIFSIIDEFNQATNTEVKKALRKHIESYKGTFNNTQAYMEEAIESFLADAKKSINRFTSKEEQKIEVEFEELKIEEKPVKEEKFGFSELASLSDDIKKNAVVKSIEAAVNYMKDSGLGLVEGLKMLHKTEDISDVTDDFFEMFCYHLAKEILLTEKKVRDLDLKKESSFAISKEDILKYGENSLGELYKYFNNTNTKPNSWQIVENAKSELMKTKINGWQNVENAKLELINSDLKTKDKFVQDFVDKAFLEYKSYAYENKTDLFSKESAENFIKLLAKYSLDCEMKIAKCTSYLDLETQKVTFLEVSSCLLSNDPQEMQARISINASFEKLASGEALFLKEKASMLEATVKQKEIDFQFKLDQQQMDIARKEQEKYTPEKQEQVKVLEKKLEFWKNEIQKKLESGSKDFINKRLTENCKKYEDTYLKIAELIHDAKISDPVESKNRDDLIKHSCEFMENLRDVLGENFNNFDNFN